MRSSGDQRGQTGQPRRPPYSGLSDDEIRVLRGSSFGTAAAAYAEHRPAYAEAAVRWSLEPVAGRKPLRVVDLGAGTGKLTAGLIRLGAEVTAIEPDPAMLAQLRRMLPGVRALTGSAEEIPLPDRAADAVVAGQAAHWFDMTRAVPEISRVLTGGGVVAGLWNVDNDFVDWVAGLNEVCEGQGTAGLSQWRRDADAYLAHAGAAAATPFRDAQRAEFENGQRRTAGSLLATLATHSGLLVMDEPERDAMLARVRGYLRSRTETAAGEFTWPMVTCVVRAIRDSP